MIVSRKRRWRTDGPFSGGGGDAFRFFRGVVFRRRNPLVLRAGDFLEGPVLPSSFCPRNRRNSRVDLVEALLAINRWGKPPSWWEQDWWHGVIAPRLAERVSLPNSIQARSEGLTRRPPSGRFAWPTGAARQFGVQRWSDKSTAHPFPIGRVGMSAVRAFIVFFPPSLRCRVVTSICPVRPGTRFAIRQHGRLATFGDNRKRAVCNHRAERRSVVLFESGVVRSHGARALPFTGKRRVCHASDHCTCQRRVFVGGACEPHFRPTRRRRQWFLRLSR